MNRPVEGRINRYYDPATGQFVSVDPMVRVTEDPYFYANDNPVNSRDLNGLIVSSPPPGGEVNINDILEDPQLLAGLNPAQVLEVLGGVPQGWALSPGIGQTVPGLRMSEFKANGVPTGNQIRWNITEGPDHSDSPQWSVAYNSKVTKVEGGDWDNGPEEYTGGGSNSGPGPCDASMNNSSGNVILVGCGSDDGGLGDGGSNDGGSDGVSPEDPTEIILGNFDQEAPCPSDNRLLAV